MKFKHAASFILCIIFTLLSTGCVTTHVHKFRMTASEAPEVHGANTQQDPHSSSWRFTGKVNYNAEKNIIISDDISESPGLDKLFDKKAEFKSAKYEMGGVDFSGKVDYLHKTSAFVIGGGLGYKDGLFSHLTIGANFSHFEFGGFLGVYALYSNIEYWGESGEDCGESDGVCETFSENNYYTYMSVFGGMYAGLYFDKLFFNLSVSSYKPNPELEGTDLNVPGITSAYLTIGYRLNRWLEVSVGGIATYIGTSEGSSYPGVTGGVSIYL